MKNPMMTRKTAPRFVDENHVLVTREFAKNARIFGTPEYKLWREIRKDCENAEMVTKTIKKNPDKKNDTKNVEAAEVAETETKEESKTNGKKKAKRSFAGFVDHVTPALFIGLISAFISNSILGAGKPETFGDGAGVLSVITLATAIIVSALLEILAKKLKLAWLEPFVMPIGMIVAMVVAIVAYNVLPPEIAILEWRG